MNGRAFVKELGKKARRKFAICLPGSSLSPSEEKMVNLGKFPTHENLKHNVEL